eukprot:363645-Chlamydomonas_euryale.AAC.4
MAPENTTGRRGVHGTVPFPLLSSICIDGAAVFVLMLYAMYRHIMPVKACMPRARGRVSMQACARLNVNKGMNACDCTGKNGGERREPARVCMAASSADSAAVCAASSCQYHSFNPRHRQSDALVSSARDHLLLVCWRSSCMYHPGEGFEETTDGMPVVDLNGVQGGSKELWLLQLPKPVCRRGAACPRHGCRQPHTVAAAASKFACMRPCCLCRVFGPACLRAAVAEAVQSLPAVSPQTFFIACAARLHACVWMHAGRACVRAGAASTATLTLHQRSRAQGCSSPNLTTYAILLAAHLPVAARSPD